MADPIRLQIINKVVERLGTNTWQGPIVFDFDTYTDQTGVVDEEDDAESRYGATSAAFSVSVQRISFIQDSTGAIIDKATWNSRFVTERSRSPIHDDELRSYIRSVKGNQQLSDIIKTVIGTDAHLGKLAELVEYSDGTVLYPEDDSSFVAVIANFSIQYMFTRGDPETAAPA